MPWTPQYPVRTRGKGTLSRTATMQVRAMWDTQAHAVQVAKECVFISGPFSMPNLAAMMNANPQLIIGPYLKSYQNPHPSTKDPHPFDEFGTKYPNAWYVHHRDGTKAAQGGTYRNWLMETGFWAETRAAKTQTGPLSGTSITANSWAEFHVTDSAKKVAQVNAQAAQNGTHPFKALWFDTNDTFSADATAGTGGSGPFWGPSAGGTSTNPGWNPHTHAAYTKPEFVNMAHWVGDMATNQTAAGSVNPERLWTVANGLRSISIADHYDMAMAEGWMVSGGLGGSMVKTQTALENSLQLALDCQLRGCFCQILEWGLAGANPDSAAVLRQKRRYIAVATLLVNRGRITMEFSDTKGIAPHFETGKDPKLYGTTSLGGATPPLDLGTPLAEPTRVDANYPSGHRVAVGTSNGQASATGLYIQKFDAGVVLLNRTSTAINYKADRTYTLLDTEVVKTAGQLISVPGPGTEIMTNDPSGSGGGGGNVTLKTPMQGAGRAGATSIQSDYLSSMNFITVYASWKELQSWASGTQPNSLSGVGVTRIDDAVTWATTNSKQIMIRLFTGAQQNSGGGEAGYPAGLALLTDTFLNKDAQDTGGATAICRYWTSAYLTAYDKLMQLMAARWDNTPEIHAITMSGPMTRYAEPFIKGMSLPQNRAELVGGGVGWSGVNITAGAGGTNAGYTMALDKAAWRSMIDAHNTRWAKTRTNLAFNPWQILLSKEESDAAGFTNTYANNSNDQHWDGNDAPGIPHTVEIMDYYKNVLGDKGVLENNSIRESYFTYGTGAQINVAVDLNPSAGMTPMYRAMLAHGGPYFYQTAHKNTGSDLIGDFNRTMSGADNVLQANAVEPPPNYEFWSTSSDPDAAQYLPANMATWNTRLKANPYPQGTGGGGSGTAPTVTLAPYVLGQPRENQTVYMQPGVYAGSPAPTLTRQWQSSANGTTGWTDITSATANTYTIPIGTGGTPTTYASDTFTRTIASGWGTATTGGGWNTLVGNAADASTNGTRGEITLNPNTSHFEELVLNKADLDATVTISFRNIATGGSMHASLNVREADSSNYYRLNLISSAATGHVSANVDKVVAGTATSIGGSAKDLGTYTGGNNITVRFRLAGTSLKGKAWNTSGGEPSTWDWDITDSSITAAGNLALRAFRSSANTNTTGPQFRYDDLTVTSINATGGTGLAGQYIRVQETATNTAGSVVSNSAALGAIVAGTADDPTWTTPPSVSGTATEGATLTANQGVITGLGSSTGGSGSIFPATGCLWGEYTDTTDNGTGLQNQFTITAREATMGRPFDLCLFFASSNPNSSTSPITTGAAQWALLNKHVIILSTSFGWGNNAFPGYAAVIGGAADSIIDSWSNALIDLQPRGTVILRQFQEMNGNWFNYSAGKNTSTYNPGFNDMWKYIVDRYIANGVDIHGKVLTNWCPNTEFAIAAITPTITDAMYPGDAYVDTFGIDLYDKDSGNTGVGMSFQSGFSTIYGRYAASGKPFIVPETGCVDHQLDQRKNWLNAATTYIKGGSVPLMKGFCYWDARGDNMDTVTGRLFEYRVDHSDPANATSSTNSLDAYKAMGNDAYFSGGTLTPTVTYQWETSATGASGSWSNVSTATSQTYSLPAGSAGSYYRVKVTAANASATVSMWSRETAQVTAGDIAPTNTTPPAITGTAEIGQTLTLTPGAWTASPPATVTEQWQTSSNDGALWTNVADTDLAYIVQTADDGDLISVLETAVNRAGTTTSRSNRIGPISTPSNFPNLTLQVAIE